MTAILRSSRWTNRTLKISDMENYSQGSVGLKITDSFGAEVGINVKAQELFDALRRQGYVDTPEPDARAVVRGLNVGTKFKFKGSNYLKVSNGSVVDLDTAQIVNLTVTFGETPGRKVRVVRKAPTA
ncbi:hypothetical protein CN1A_8 [Clavibacter phage CN1A]|uniref:Uncharacterized protein n=1 Tax=Clavibacter phage CN1A TaxID=1406793 RepID=U5PX12_9CAUD|nr:hypothetical protein CN1A_8 [Clavibacter phage CN1A]AGY47117.1 hypothetical protein CN1A_8 [Clavibacter phage CN1A]